MPFVAVRSATPTQVPPSRRDQRVVGERGRDSVVSMCMWRERERERERESERGRERQGERERTDERREGGRERKQGTREADGEREGGRGNGSGAETSTQTLERPQSSMHLRVYGFEYSSPTLCAFSGALEIPTGDGHESHK